MGTYCYCLLSPQTSTTSELFQGGYLTVKLQLSLSSDRQLKFSQISCRSGLSSCSAEKYRPDTTAEALRSGDTGCVVGKYRNGMVRDGAEAGTGDLMAINNLPVVSYRNIGLDFDKTGFGANKENKEAVSNK